MMLTAEAMPPSGNVPLAEMIQSSPRLLQVFCAKPPSVSKTHERMVFFAGSQPTTSVIFNSEPSLSCMMNDRRMKRLFIDQAHSQVMSKSGSASFQDPIIQARSWSGPAADASAETSGPTLDISHLPSGCF